LLAVQVAEQTLAVVVVLVVTELQQELLAEELRPNLQFQPY
jgi:hypothetical protein